MSHKTKTRKQSDEEKEFKKRAFKLAKERLERAIEWVNHGDAGWAITLIKSAEHFLEAIRQY